VAMLVNMVVMQLELAGHTWPAPVSAEHRADGPDAGLGAGSEKRL
jgi:hypothetical protein